MTAKKSIFKLYYGQTVQFSSNFIERSLCLKNILRWNRNSVEGKKAPWLWNLQQQMLFHYAHIYSSLRSHLLWSVLGVPWHCWSLQKEQESLRRCSYRKFRSWRQHDYQLTSFPIFCKMQTALSNSLLNSRTFSETTGERKIIKASNMRPDNIILSNAHLRFHWKGETIAENHCID